MSESAGWIHVQTFPATPSFCNWISDNTTCFHLSSVQLNRVSTLNSTPELQVLIWWEEFPTSGFSNLDRQPRKINYASCAPCACGGGPAQPWSKSPVWGHSSDRLDKRPHTFRFSTHARREKGGINRTTRRWWTVRSVTLHQACHKCVTPVSRS